MCLATPVVPLGLISQQVDNHSLSAAPVRFVILACVQGARKTFQQDDSGEWTDAKAAWVAAAAAAGCGVLTAAVVLPVLAVRSRRHFEQQQRQFAG